MKKIKLPVLKISTNKIYAGIHWTKRNQHKDKFRVMCNAIKTLDKIDYPVNLRFDFYLGGRALDSSNCSYMAKMIEDCFVKFGIFKDDNIKYIHDFTCRSHQVKGLKEHYCIVTIEKDQLD